MPKGKWIRNDGEEVVEVVNYNTKRMEVTIRYTSEVTIDIDTFEEDYHMDVQYLLNDFFKYADFTIDSYCAENGVSKKYLTTAISEVLRRVK
jgi:hypothetical protein